MSNIFFTVFTPTYNRSTLIHRVFDSLNKQAFRNFEWLIIDDGSTDDTESVISSFREQADFPIRYFKKCNQGKVLAINDALDLADGEFFLVFDSDDWCTDDALERFHTVWLSIENKEKYCAISCLKSYSDSKVVGERYNKYLGSMNNYVDRFNLQVKGDKWECIKTKIHKDCKYDVHAGEKYQAPEYAWLKMGKNYSTLFVDEVLSIVEYQADGISNNNIAHRVGSSFSTLSFYVLALSCSKNVKMRFRSLANLVRFAAHSKKLKYRYIFNIPSFFFGYILFTHDKYKLKKVDD